MPTNVSIAFTRIIFNAYHSLFIFITFTKLHKIPLSSWLLKITLVSAWFLSQFDLQLSSV